MVGEVDVPQRTTFEQEFGFKRMFVLNTRHVRKEVKGEASREHNKGRTNRPAFEREPK